MTRVSAQRVVAIRAQPLSSHRPRMASSPACLWGDVLQAASAEPQVGEGYPHPGSHSPPPSVGTWQSRPMALKPVLRAVEKAHTQCEGLRRPPPNPPLLTLHKDPRVAPLTEELLCTSSTWLVTVPVTAVSTPVHSPHTVSTSSGGRAGTAAVSPKAAGPPRPCLHHPRSTLPGDFQEDKVCFEQKSSGGTREPLVGCR